MTDPADVSSSLQPPQHVVEFAVKWAMLSPCRSKRCAVIFRGGEVVSHGYNYKPRGFDCDGSDACKATCRDEAVHAEQQALMAAGNRSVAGSDMLHVKAVDGRLVPSGGPSCVQCSKLVLASGIAGFWLYHADGWRRYEAADFHQRSLAHRASSRSQLQEENRRLQLALATSERFRLEDGHSHITEQLRLHAAELALSQIQEGLTRIKADLAMACRSSESHAAHAAALSARIERLVADGFVQHLPRCRSKTHSTPFDNGEWQPAPCSCGLADRLSSFTRQTDEGRASP